MSELTLRRRCRMELLRSRTRIDEAHALRVQQARRQVEGFYRNDPAPLREDTPPAWREGRAIRVVELVLTTAAWAAWLALWAALWFYIGAAVLAP